MPSKFFAAVALAGCGGGSDSNAGFVAAVTYLDKSGLHEIDQAITVDGKIPADAVTVAIHMQSVLKATKWPTSGLTSDANKVAGLLAAFVKAADTDKPDMAAVTKACNTAHAAWHEFLHEAWDRLQHDAKVSGSAGDSH